MKLDVHPWRRRIAFLESEEASIRPLIEQLCFIENKQQWGYSFRSGVFEVERADFERIAEAMNAALGDEL